MNIASCTVHTQIFCHTAITAHIAHRRGAGIKPRKISHEKYITSSLSKLNSVHSSLLLKVAMLSQWLCGVFVVLALSCGAYGQGLTEEEQEEIMNAHNYYRGLVDPISTNMLKMVS